MKNLRSLKEYWPLVLSVLALVVWCVRLEAKADNALRQSTKAEAVPVLVEAISNLKNEMSYLRADIGDLRKDLKADRKRILLTVPGK